MSSPTSSFKTVLRGYDPSEVDAHIATLKEHQKGLRQQIADVEEQLAAVTEPNFAHLGERVGQILTLAEQEAAALRKKTSKEVETQRTNAADGVRRLRKEAEEYAVATRAEADEYALTARTEADEYSRVTRTAADTEAARILQEATDQAAGVTEAAQAELDRIVAEHERTVRDNEEDLARRRAKAEAERAETERLDRERADAANREATAIVAEAQEKAERIRLDAEREVAEIERRSESINAQLANVRRALAHLTGEASDPPQAALFEAPAKQA
jgi:cell division septum initiation protein DivIVA